MGMTADDAELEADRTRARLQLRRYGCQLIVMRGEEGACGTLAIVTALLRKRHITDWQADDIMEAAERVGPITIRAMDVITRLLHSTLVVLEWEDGRLRRRDVTTWTDWRDNDLEDHDPGGAHPAIGPRDTQQFRAVWIALRDLCGAFGAQNGDEETCPDEVDLSQDGFHVNDTLVLSAPINTVTVYLERSPGAPRTYPDSGIPIYHVNLIEPLGDQREYANFQHPASIRGRQSYHPGRAPAWRNVNTPDLSTLRAAKIIVKAVNTMRRKGQFAGQQLIEVLAPLQVGWSMSYRPPQWPLDGVALIASIVKSAIHDGTPVGAFVPHDDTVDEERRPRDTRTARTRAESEVLRLEIRNVGEERWSVEQKAIKLRHQWNFDLIPEIASTFPDCACAVPQFGPFQQCNCARSTLRRIIFTTYRTGGAPTEGTWKMLESSGLYPRHLVRTARNLRRLKESLQSMIAKHTETTDELWHESDKLIHETERNRYRFMVGMETTDNSTRIERVLRPWALKLCRTTGKGDTCAVQLVTGALRLENKISAAQAERMHHAALPVGPITMAGLHALGNVFMLVIHAFELVDGQLQSLPQSLWWSSGAKSGAHPYAGDGADESICEAWNTLVDVFTHIYEENQDDARRPFGAIPINEEQHVYALVTGEREGRKARGTETPLLHVEQMLSTRLQANDFSDRGADWRSVKVAEGIVRAVNEAHEKDALAEISPTLLTVLQELRVFDEDGTSRPGVADDVPPGTLYRAPNRMDYELIDSIIRMTLHADTDSRDVPTTRRPLPMSGGPRDAHLLPDDSRSLDTQRQAHTLQDTIERHDAEEKRLVSEKRAAIAARLNHFHRYFGPGRMFTTDCACGSPLLNCSCSKHVIVTTIHDPEIPVGLIPLVVSTLALPHERRVINEMTSAKRALNSINMARQHIDLRLQETRAQRADARAQLERARN